MEIEKITAEYAVTGQIDPKDLDQIREAGFKSIICNRPDGEAEGQPAFSEIAAAADVLGLPTAHVPVVPNDIRDEHVNAFAHAFVVMPKPVLAYCFSGGRAKMLWAKSQSETV